MSDAPYEIVCDDVTERLLCGEKAIILIVMDANLDADSSWFVTAYCVEHAQEAAQEAEEFMSGEYVIVTLGQPAEEGATT